MFDAIGDGVAGLNEARADDSVTVPAADIVWSAFQDSARAPVLGHRFWSSNSMLGCGPTTPQDYPERSGFAPRRERECGHRRH